MKDSWWLIVFFLEPIIIYWGTLRGTKNIVGNYSSLMTEKYHVVPGKLIRKHFRISRCPIDWRIYSVYLMTFGVFIRIFVVYLLYILGLFFQFGIRYYYIVSIVSIMMVGWVGLPFIVYLPILDLKRWRRKRANGKNKKSPTVRYFKLQKEISFLGMHRSFRELHWQVAVGKDSKKYQYYKEKGIYYVLEEDLGKLERKITNKYPKAYSERSQDEKGKPIFVVYNKDNGKELFKAPIKKKK